jgi:hypothetical protein
MANGDKRLATGDKREGAALVERQAVARLVELRNRINAF